MQRKYFELQHTPMC